MTGLVRSARTAIRTKVPARPFYGWWVVAGGIGIQALINVLFGQAYGAYVVLLQRDFGWSKTMLSTAYSIGQAEGGLIGPLQGWLADKLGPRAIVRTGLLIMGLGLMLLSRVESRSAFFVALFVISVGSSVAGMLSIHTAVVNWFRRRRALAIGLVTGGSAMGGLLVPVTVLALDTWGWRTTAFASGIIVIAAGWPCAQLLRRRPEDYGYEIDGGALPDTEPRRQAAAGIDFTLRQALSTRQFWFVSAGHGSALLIVSAVMVHLVPHLHDNLGYSLAKAGLIVSLLTFAQIVGTVGGGYCGDRWSKRGIATGCMFVHAGALVLLAYASALWMVLAFAVLHGLAWGTRGPLMSAIRADYFGRAAFGAITGLSQMIAWAGLTSGPIIAGVLADRTGDYRAGFTVLATLASIGSVFFMLAPRPLRAR